MLSDPSASSPLLAGSRANPTRIRLLLEAAERAYAHGEAETLAAAARELIPDVPRALQYELVAVAELARLDLDVARHRWAQIRGRIRERSGHPDGL
jgi:hypothetical protein